MTIASKIIWISTMVASLGMAETVEDIEAMPVEGLAPSVINMGNADEIDSKYSRLSKSTHIADDNVILEMRNGVFQRKIDTNISNTTPDETDVIDAEGLAPASVDMSES